MFYFEKEYDKITPMTLTLTLYMQYLHMELGLADNTVDAYQNDILSLLLFYNNTTSNCIIDDENIASHIKENKNIDLSPLIKIDSNNIVSLMAKMRKDGLSIETILRRLSGISQFFNYLLLEKLIKVNPIEFIIKPKRWGKLPIFLTFEEVEKMLNYRDKNVDMGLRNSLMIELLYSSGMRVSELISIKTTDIDFKRGIVTVMGKGSKMRIVPIYDKLLVDLKNYLPVRLEKFVKKSDDGYLFLNRYGDGLTRQYVWQWIKAVCKSVDIKKNISPHTLRHCFATHLLSGGADLRTIQIFLGHENISTTEIYTHLADDDKRNILANFHPRYK